MSVSSLGAAPARRRYSAIILTEGGEKVVDSEPDAAAAPHPSEHPASHPAQGPAGQPTGHLGDEPVSAEPAPASRPRIARRPPSPDRILPDITSDERDVGWGEVPEPDDDERLLRDVPPHHGS
jgi:hypothetical protein